MSLSAKLCTIHSSKGSITWLYCAKLFTKIPLIGVYWIDKRKTANPIWFSSSCPMDWKANMSPVRSSSKPVPDHFKIVVKIDGSISFFTFYPTISWQIYFYVCQYIYICLTVEKHFQYIGQVKAKTNYLNCLSSFNWVDTN